MKTAIIYYSKHHGNTKKLLDAIVQADPSVVLIDVTAPQQSQDLSTFDRIGIASGIYFSAFAKQVMEYARMHLPVNKDVFYIYTHGAPVGGFLKGIRSIAEKKHCCGLGSYHSLGFDTFGPFKAVGGIAKGHPNDKEIAGAVSFYESLGGGQHDF